ncbi:unnamed protein product [Alternaria alternata]
MTGHRDEEEEHSRRSQETPKRRFASLPNDDPLPLQREQAENSDSDTSTREPTNPALSNLPDATTPQGKDHLPEPHSSQQERVSVVDDQEGSHTAVNCSQSPPSPREERSPARDGLEDTTHRPSVPQQLQSAVVTDISPNKGQELLAEYARLRRLPILSIDPNTYDGQLQFLAMMQDFASWMASNSGSIQRGNLGLEIPHLAAVFYPQYEGLNTMIMSKWSTQVPNPIQGRLDHVFSSGDMFWFRTSEYATNPKQQLGDKCGLTARGLMLSGWRLILVLKVLPNVLLCTWGRTTGDSDLSKTNRRDRWQFARLLRSDRRNWPRYIEAKDSPHGNIFMDPTNARDWPVQDLKDHCNFNVLVSQEVIPTDGFKYAGRLEDESHNSVEWIRNAFYFGIAVMPEAPTGVNVTAVQRGIADIRTPRSPPSVPKRVRRDFFPTADKMLPLSPYIPPPAGHAPVYKDLTATPRVPRGPRGATEVRFERDRNNSAGRRFSARSTYGQDPDRQRGRSRSRSPRDRQNGRFRDYSRRRSPPPQHRSETLERRGRPETRDETNHRSEDYDRSQSRHQRSPTRRFEQPPDLRLDNYINKPTLNAYGLVEANAVKYDDHDGDRLLNYNANCQPSNRDRNRGRGQGDYHETNRGPGERRPGGGRGRGGRRR